MYKKVSYACINFKVMKLSLWLMYIVFTWLHAAPFITLVQKSMWQLFKCDHYSIDEDVVYSHNFEIDCGTDQVQLLFKVRRLTK